MPAVAPTDPALAAADATSARASRVWTVTGPVDPRDLGTTLVHEHVLLDGSCFFEPDDADDADAFAAAPLTPELVPRVRAASCSNRDNLLLRDLELAAAELGEFARLGGRTIVDVTSGVGLGRDVTGL